MTEKIDQVTGVVTVAIGGVTAALTPADALVWGDTLMSLAPLGLILFLIWRVRVVDKQLQQCRQAHQRVAEQLLLAFTAIKDPTVEVIQGKYDLNECIGGQCNKD